VTPNCPKIKTNTSTSTPHTHPPTPTPTPTQDELSDHHQADGGSVRATQLQICAMQGRRQGEYYRIEHALCLETGRLTSAGAAAAAVAAAPPAAAAAGVVNAAAGSSGAAGAHE